MLATRPFASIPSLALLPRLLLMLLLALNTLPAVVPLPAPLPISAPAERSTPTLSASEQASIRELIRQAEYYATPLARPDGAPAFEAPNRANGLHIAFQPDAAYITPSGEQPAWQASMGLASYGYAGATLPVNGMPTLTAHEGQVTYQWPAISEWYVNNEAGLKHNLTLHAPPAGTPSRLLQFNLHLGGLHPTPASDGSSVALLAANGSEALHLGAIYAYDASGRTLAAHYGEPVAAGGTTLLPMLVEAENATYPITVDPLVSTRVARVTATTPTADATFGLALAISNDVMVVGSVESPGGAAYVFYRNQGAADGWNLIRRLTPTGAIGSTDFGKSVDLDGDILAVGAPGENSNNGAAYVFYRNQGGADTWGQVQRVVSNAPTVSEQFGFAVAISNNQLVVGAPLNTSANPNSGAINFFLRNQGGADNWGFANKLALAPANSRFGSALDMSGDLLLVGLPGASTAPADSNGVAFLLRNTGDADWSVVVELRAADRASFDAFGSSVALDNDVAVIGAPGQDAQGNNSGAAYVFTRNQGGANVWGQTQKLTLPLGEANALLGTDVAVSGDTVIVGAPGSSTNKGAAYLYLRNQGGADLWGFNSQLSVDDAPAGQLGRSVAIDGLFIALGAPTATVGGQANAGAAYTFIRSGNAWAEFARRQDNEAGEQDNFAFALAVSGDTLVVSTAGDDLVANDTGNRGAAYILRRNQGAADGWNILKKLVHPAPAGGDDYGYSLAIDGDTIAVGARRDDLTGPAVTNGGSVFIYRRNTGGADNWGLVKTLNLSPGIAQATDDVFGYALALHGDTLAVGAPGRDDVSANQGRIYIYERNTGGAENWGLVTPTGITGSDSLTGDNIGTVLALDGDTLVAGVPMDNGAATDSGSVFIFARNQGGANAWGQVAKLLPPTGEQQLNDYYGSSVALDGDTLAVGAQGELGTGAVYLYRRNSSGANAWGAAVPVAKIVATPETGVTAVGGFGASVALDNDTLLVGARGSDNVAAADTGSAYVFNRNQGGADTWGQVAQFTAGANAVANDQFGFSVALGTGIAFVGAPYGATPPTPFNTSGTDLAGGTATREAVHIFSLNDTVVPTITNVTSSNPDGTYVFGNTISIQVTFSEPVFVIGAPTLTLETGPVDRNAVYSSGSGSAILTFNYTVQAGDTTPDLDYINTAALALAGGIIRDLAGNNATLTLPAPAAAGSLGANKAIVIDGILPTVTNVSSTTAAGTYGIGATISIQVTFSEPVNVTGAPTLTLETGGVDALAAYASGSGTNTLNFTYTVVENDVSADLDYASTAALALNGGTINDGSGNPADLTLPAPGAAGSLAANEALVIDGVRPAVILENVAPDPRTIAVTTLTITFSEAVIGLGIEEFALTRNGTPVDISGVTITGGPVTYVLNGLAGATNLAGAYVLTLNPGNIVDGAGNGMAFAASESWNLTPAATTTNLTSAPNPSVFGQTVTLNVTVTSAGGTPTGSVEFFAAGVSLGIATLDGSGAASITIANLPVGTTALTANYQGNPNAPAFAPSSSATVNHVVNKASTTMVTNALPTTAVFGEPVTITSAVTATAPGAGTPTGNVIFSRGAGAIGVAALNNGVATLTVNNLPVGINNLLGTYNGDANFLGSSDGASVTVSSGVVTVTLTSQPNPSGVGQDVVFTATVTPQAPSVLIPTGTVEFFNGATSLGVVTIDANGVATLTISTLPTGNNLITADYSGNGGYAAQTSAVYTHVVDARIAVLRIASSANPSFFGQTVTFTATISAGIGTPTGSVQFFNGATSLATLPLNSGEAVLTLANLPIGTNPIRVEYPGDATFDPASDVLDGGQVVNKANTSVALTTAPNPSVRGQGVIMTASVGAVAPGAGTPTGTVEFFANNGVSLGIVPLSSGGIAVLNYSLLPVGVNSINAVYSGSGTYNTSTSPAANQVVNKANTSTVLTTTPNPSLLNERVRLTVNVVASTPGSGTPTGSVEFRSNGVPIGTVPLNGGVAILDVTNFPLGTSLITAAYSGDTNYNPSVSNGINQVVRQTRPSTILLPMVFNSYTNTSPLPDLVVSAIRSQNGQLEVVITNNGGGAVQDAFWVDLYIDPTTAPTGPNQTWDQVGSRGLVWGVNDLGLPILPGESITLTPGDEFYNADFSNPDGPITPGSILYAQVDSADATQPTGGNIGESDELPGGVYNNITQATASSTIPLPGPRGSEAQVNSSVADLPRRR
jgi:hypothetical protein